MSWNGSGLSNEAIRRAQTPRVRTKHRVGKGKGCVIFIVAVGGSALALGGSVAYLGVHLL